MLIWEHQRKTSKQALRKGSNLGSRTFMLQPCHPSIQWGWKISLHPMDTSNALAPGPCPCPPLALADIACPYTPSRELLPIPEGWPRTSRALGGLSDLPSSEPVSLVSPDTANFDPADSSPTWYLYGNESHPCSLARGHFWILRARLRVGLTFPPSWTGPEVHGLIPSPSTLIRDHLGPGPQSSSVGILSASSSLDSKDMLERMSEFSFSIHGIENGVLGHLVSHILAGYIFSHQLLAHTAKEGSGEQGMSCISLGAEEGRGSEAASVMPSSAFLRGGLSSASGPQPRFAMSPGGTLVSRRRPIPSPKSSQTLKSSAPWGSIFFTSIY